MKYMYFNHPHILCKIYKYKYIKCVDGGDTQILCNYSIYNIVITILM